MNVLTVITKDKIPFIVFFILYSLFVCSGLGQNARFRFENITHTAGLADININAIIQDRHGFIWFGSEDGLTRYDGYTCVLFRHQPDNPNSLSDNEVNGLCLDDEGAIWVGTRNGLNRYDSELEKFETFFHDSTNDKSLASNEIFALSKAPDGNIWVGTYGGGLDLIVKNKNSKADANSGYRFIHHRYSESDSTTISHNQVFSVYADKSGYVWAGTYNGLNVLSPDKKKFTRLYNIAGDNSTIANSTVNRIFAEKDNSIWICGKGMLDKIGLERDASGFVFSVQHFLPGLTGTRNLDDWAVNDFMVDQEGNGWLATNDQGLIHFTINNRGTAGPLINFNYEEQSPYSIANTIIVKLFQDRSGVIWIGTNKGVSKYVPSKNRFSEVTVPESFQTKQNDAILAVLCDSKQRVWLAWDSDKLAVLKNDTGRDVLKDKEELPGVFSGLDQVNALFESRKGDIYIGTLLNGLYLIPAAVTNINEKKNWIQLNSKNQPGLPSDNIYSLAEDKQGNIWVGTYKGLSVYYPDQKAIKKIYASPQGNVISGYIIRSISIDEKENIWCGTDDGLHLFKDEKKVMTFTSRENDTASLTNNRINVVYTDKNKNLWIGTKEGLNLFNPERRNFTRYAARNGLPNEGVRSIREDGSGNLWIGSNHGLIKFNKTAQKFSLYSLEDGLCSDNFEMNCSAAGPGGILYFGTNNGLVSFKAENIIPNSYIPPVTITNIKILDQQIKDIGDTALINIYRREKKLQLKYNQNFFSFEFAALNYINTPANKYAYILEGVDPQWNNAGTQRFAGYTDIKPGHYIFKVKGSNNDGVWNEQPVTIDVIIAPPWWQAWWFYTLCFLAFCTIIYIIYRVRLRHVLQLYKLRSSIAKDLHDDVGSALSSIAMLSRIAHDGKTNARLKPEEVFSRISDTSKRMIDLMDDIVWSVNPDNDRFSNMLIRMREYAVEMLESNSIDFTFKVSEDIDELRIPMQMRKDYFLVFKEAVNNLAKYSGCAQASITIERIHRNIVTVITDNGKGFDPQVITSGNGLRNMQARAAALNGKLEFQTAAGKGTTVKLTISVS